MKIEAKLYDDSQYVELRIIYSGNNDFDGFTMGKKWDKRYPAEYVKEAVRHMFSEMQEKVLQKLEAK